ncbi:MAG: serine/threonine-protein kinase, partial [Phycisphaerales bacterium]|nr:serine/threonine-protein kinase [Phycisphaerales bacterium]
LDVAPGEREAFVRERAAGDERVAADVLALLDALGSAEGPGASGATAFEEASGVSAEGAAMVGSWVGPYRLMELIGEGGFGLVFVAEQLKPLARRVAVKVVKAGMDSVQVLARFEAERQALAMMDHPNIARVLDAGTTGQGRPYFVMELVRGVPITRYCDQAQLTTAQRLALMVPVCHAVQHAHGKGVIHRDIKPGNVLVTMHDGEPVPKVIDFGIAKAVTGRLSEASVYTGLRQMVGTPAYMSPEQAEMSGLDVDTRADVYSLGALVYELLTGTPPLDGNSLLRLGLAEMQRVIRDTDPPRPSTRVSASGERLAAIASSRRAAPTRLIAMMRGDLDCIVMKAMEKDRRRRYVTAEAMAADIRRHLAGEVVEARPASRAYRVTRFVRRNRGAVIAGVAVFAALATGFGVSLAAFVRAAGDRDRAASAEVSQRRAAEEAVAARKLADLRAERSRLAAEVSQVGAAFMDWGLGFAGPEFAGGTDARLLTMPGLVDASAARVAATYGDRPRLEAAARYHLGRMYTALGRVEECGEQLRAALALWDQHGLPDEVTFATACSELEFCEYQRGVGPRSGNVLRARKFAVEVAYLESESSRFAGPLRAWGKAMLSSPRAEEAEIGRAWKGLLAAWKAGPPARGSDELLLVVDAMCTPVCKVAIEGRSAAAREAGLAIAREIGAFCPEQFTRNVETLFMALGLVGALDTDALQRERLALCERLMAADLGGVARDHWVQSFARFYQGRTLTRLGQRAEGEALMVEGLEGLRAARGAEDAYFGESFDALLGYAGMAGRYPLLRGFDAGEGVPLAAEINAMVRAAGGPEFKAAALRLAEALRALPVTGQEQKRLARVLVTPVSNLWDGWQLDNESGVAIMDAVLEGEASAGSDATARLAFAAFKMLRADAAAFVKDYDLAERLLQELLATRLELLGPDSWIVAASRAKLGSTLILHGRFEEGERQVKEAYERLVWMVGANFRDSLLCIRRLAIAWASMGRPEKIGDLMERWIGKLEGNVDPEPALASARRAAWELVRRPGLPASEYARAERGMRGLVERYDGRPDDRLYLAMALWRMGRAGEATAELRALDEGQIKSKAKRAPVALLTLAASLHGLGDAEGARRALSDAEDEAAAATLVGVDRLDVDELLAEVRPLVSPEAPVR